MTRDRLARLDLRITQLAAQRSATARREARGRVRLINRRKFLIGACILALAEGDITGVPEEVRRALDSWAVRPRDREALGLPSKSGPTVA
jgi:hypothetical protein